MNAYCLHTIIKSKNCKSKHCKLGLSMYVLSLSTTLKILVLFSHSVMSYSLRPHGLPARQPSLSFTISWSLLKLRSMKSMMPSYHLILCHPLLLLPSVFPCIKVFSNELPLCIRWPEYWSFSFIISPSNEYSRVYFL